MWWVPGYLSIFWALIRSKWRQSVCLFFLYGSIWLMKPYETYSLVNYHSNSEYPHFQYSKQPRNFNMEGKTHPIEKEHHLKHTSMTLGSKREFSRFFSFCYVSLPERFVGTNGSDQPLPLAAYNAWRGRKHDTKRKHPSKTNTKMAQKNNHQQQQVL